MKMNRTAQSILLGIVILGILLASYSVTARGNQAAAAGLIVINLGDDIQSAVDSNPTGTTFIIKAGVHRFQSVVPKDGDSFIGEPGAIISGARLLASFQQEGQYWVATGQTQQGQVHGSCISGYSGCRYPEDLFINDIPLWQVTTIDEVGPGKWYFDYDADKIYMAEDPTGGKVETSVTSDAFHGDAGNVTIRGLIIEKYASSAQHGTIHGQRGTNGPFGSDWLVEDNVVRWNHGAGIKMGHRMQVLRNNIHTNGQLGIGVGHGGITTEAIGILVEGNEIAYNNYAGFNWGWEAGGSKFTRTNGLSVRNNYVHHNKGPGLWTDIDNVYTLYEGNIVEDNDGMGIFHEISYDAVIRNNTVKRNSRPWSPWLYGAQIMISSSRNTEVQGNMVVVAADGGNGITMVQQNRGTGAYGPRITINNYVHHNQITYLDNSGVSGGAADFDHDTFYNGNNEFDYNIYHAPRLDLSRWKWKETRDWSGFKAAGREANGVADSLPISSPPAANNQSVTTAEDTPVAITLTGSDPDGDPLTFSVVTPPTSGSLTGTPPNVTYTPNANFSGPDSFTYIANDGTVTSASATVSITVNPAPPATPDPEPAGVTVESIAPNSVTKGTTIDIEIIGSGFVDQVEVTFENGGGPIPRISNVVFNSNTGNITATVTARGGGPKHRVWDVRVTNPDGSSGVLAGGFTVTP